MVSEFSVQGFLTLLFGFVLADTLQWKPMAEEAWSPHSKSKAKRNKGSWEPNTIFWGRHRIGDTEKERAS
jgi:hypothetical protein